MKQFTATDETGQVWVIQEGDPHSLLWADNPWLPDNIMAPRKLFLRTPSEVVVRQHDVAREDATNDKAMREVVNNRIFKILDDKYYHGAFA